MIASFRDPAGRLLFVDGRVVRIIQPAAAVELKALLTSEEIKNFIARGKLVRTEILDANASEKLSTRPEVRAALADFGPHAFVEHERIPFATFPYEWPPEMLYAAAELTLDIAERLLPEGFGLKDATPYNILFRGPDAVFVDLLSFERRDPLDQTWLPYAQFSRTFLLPLLVNKNFGIKLDQIFLAKGDGLDPEEVAQLCGPIQSIRPPFLALVTLPVRLSGRALADDTTIYQKHRASSRDKAQFILGRIFKTLRRQLERLRPTVERTSVWSRYTEQNMYTDDYQPNKQRFVSEAMAVAQPRRVLDVGCSSESQARFACSLIGTRAAAVTITSRTNRKSWSGRAPSQGSGHSDSRFCTFPSRIPPSFMSVRTAPSRPIPLTPMPITSRWRTARSASCDARWRRRTFGTIPLSSSPRITGGVRRLTATLTSASPSWSNSPANGKARPTRQSSTPWLRAH